MEAYLVAHQERPQGLHGLNADGHEATLGALSDEGSTRQIHLRDGPTSKKIAPEALVSPGRATVRKWGPPGTFGISAAVSALLRPTVPSNGLPQQAASPQWANWSAGSWFA